MSTVLLVDDDPGIVDALVLALEGLGHRVGSAASGDGALHALFGAGDQAYDVVVLDVMMPGMSGLEVTRRVRAASVLPIILLSALGDADDVVAGLEAGADDYVVKPVAPRVLDARIRAVVRRTTAGPVLQVGDLRIDETAATVTRGDEPVRLTATEFRLLVELARNAGAVLSRSVLLDRVWDYGFDGDSRIVDVTVQRLRAKLEPIPSDPRYVVTVRGLGYKVVRA